MFQRLLAFAAGATLSMSAFATPTYTQYDFFGPDITGYFIQRDDNKAIAKYWIQVYGQYVNASFHPFGQESNIVAANVSHTGDGPTSFTVFDLLSESYTKTLRVNFESGSNGYAAMYEQTINPGYTGPNYDTHYAKFTSFAGVTKGTVNPSVAAEIDSYGGYIDGINRIEPTHRLPEPASLGLLAVGALAAVGAGRRRRTTG